MERATITHVLSLCHLHNIIPEPCRQFNRTWFALFSPPNPTETMVQSCQALYHFHSTLFYCLYLEFDSCSLGIWVQLQEVISVSPLTTIWKMELRTSIYDGFEFSPVQAQGIRKMLTFDLQVCWLAPNSNNWGSRPGTYSRSDLGMFFNH